MMASRKYRPSNGTEGMFFEEEHCLQCLHCDPNPAGRKQCSIWCRALSFNINDPEYPSEWVYGDNGKPTCTNWQKWDWGNDGDPDDPDNPKAPIPNDPNQLSLFPLYPDEKNFEVKIKVESGSSYNSNYDEIKMLNNLK